MNLERFYASPYKKLLSQTKLDSSRHRSAPSLPDSSYRLSLSKISPIKVRKKLFLNVQDAVPEGDADPELKQTLGEFERFVIDFSGAVGKAFKFGKTAKKIASYLMKLNGKKLIEQVDFEATYEGLLDRILTHIETFLKIPAALPSQQFVQAFANDPKAHPSLRDDQGTPKKNSALLTENSEELTAHLYGDRAKGSPSLLFGQSESGSSKYRWLKEFWTGAEKTLSDKELKFLKRVVLTAKVGQSAQAFEKLVYDQTTDLLKELFEKLTAPDSLQKLMESAILPAVFKVMITTYSEQIFRSFPKEIGPLFHRLIVKNDATGKAAICQKIWELSRHHAIQLGTSTFDQLDRKEFDQNMDPLIDRYADALMKTVQRNQGLVSTKEITESLIKLFEFDEKDEDSFIEEIKVEERFGKAIYQLIQKIGGFDSTVLSLGVTLFEKKVSRICSASLINLKTNRYQFFSSLLKEAHAKFTDEKFVEEWIDGDNIQTTSEKNLHQVAALTHDMIMLGSGGWGGAVRLVIGKTPRYLEKTIKKIIQTLFGHQLCNINLLGQIQEVVIEALKDSFRQFSQSYVPLQEGREIESLLTSHRLKEGGI